MRPIKGCEIEFPEPIRLFAVLLALASRLWNRHIASMKKLIAVTTLLLSLASHAIDLPRGTLTFQAADATQTDAGYQWDYNAARWGMYTVFIASSGQTASPVELQLGDASLSGDIPAGTNHIEKLGPLYLAKQGKMTLSIRTRCDISYVMLQPAPEGEAITQTGSETIILAAKNAITHSEKMRYEPNPKKNCLGFWTNPDDWAAWTFAVKTPGTYNVEVTQGCGGGNGGSDVEVSHGEQTLTFIVEDTGGFQKWQAREIGTLVLKAGQQALEIRPKSKKKSAVMDIHLIRLIPVK